MKRYLRVLLALLVMIVVGSAAVPAQASSNNHWGASITKVLVKHPTKTINANRLDLYLACDTKNGPAVNYGCIWDAPLRGGTNSYVLYSDGDRLRLNDQSCTASVTVSCREASNPEDTFTVWRNINGLRIQGMYPGTGPVLPTK